MAPLNYFYPVKIEKCQGQKVAKSLGLLVATNAGLYIMLDQIPFIMIKRSFFPNTISVTSSKQILSQKSLSIDVSIHALSPSVLVVEPEYIANLGKKQICSGC